MSKSFSLGDSSRKLLAFQQSLMSSNVPFGSSDKISEMKPYAWGHLQWYWEAQRSDKIRKLRNFMIRLDDANKINREEEQIKKLYEGIETIMTNICRRIDELQPAFRGSLVKMGSAYNDMKIGEVDEFDFTYELDLSNLLKNRGKYKKFAVERGFIAVYTDVQGSPTDFDLFEFPDQPELEEVLSVNGSKDAIRYKHLLSETDEGFKLSTEHLGYGFFLLLDRVVSELELPKEWSHGGYLRPSYSGLRLHIPSFLIQFEYHGAKNGIPLLVSIDFAPVVKIPVNVILSNEDIVAKYLRSNGYVCRPWLRLDRSTHKSAFTSQAEERWLAEYPPTSIAKKVVRICKALNNLVNLKTPKFLPRYMAKRLAKFRQTPEKGRDSETIAMLASIGSNVELNFLIESEKFATYQDLGENVGGHEYIASYMFKRAVMTLMVLDEFQGKRWSEEDIPDLVMSVFMVTNDVVMAVNQSMPVPANEERSEDMVTFELLPRADITAKESQKGAELIFMDGKVEITWDVHFSRKLLSGSGLSREKVNPEEDVDERAHSEKTIGKMPSFYEMLRRAIQDGSCQGFVYLFYKRRFSLMKMKMGMDYCISQLFQLLRSVAEGLSTATISVRRGPLYEDDLELLESVNESLVTKEELKEMLKQSDSPENASF